MTKKNSESSLANLVTLIDARFHENYEIDLISLSSTDGFDIHCIKSPDSTIEIDKLAAIASSVYALSNASVKQISDSDLNVITVETKNGNLLFLKSTFNQKATVLSVSSKSDMPLGETRYIATRLASDIDAIQES